MAGMLSNLGALFANPNFQQTLFGVGQMMDQQSHQRNVARAVGNAQNQILQGGGSFLDAQRMGAFIQANNPYQMPLMGMLGQGFMGYQQNQQQAAANAAMLQLMLMGMGDEGMMQSPQAQALFKQATGSPAWGGMEGGKTTQGFGNYPKPYQTVTKKTVENDPSTPGIREITEVFKNDPKSQTSPMQAQSLEAQPSANRSQMIKDIATGFSDPYDQYAR